MQPTRPILTFTNWMLHHLKVSEKPHLKVVSILKDAGFNHVQLGSSILMNLEKELAFMASFSLPSVINHKVTNLYFKSKEDADLAFSIVGGEYSLLTREKTPLRSTAIFGNFTLKDLIDLHGDPLPLKYKALLLDCRSRGGNYFSDFHHMHQDWGLKWWPAEFIYRCRSGAICHDEDSAVLRDMKLNLADLRLHSCGVEFRYKKDAMLFKLITGEDPFHPITLRQIEEGWDHFVDKLYELDRGF